MNDEKIEEMISRYKEIMATPSDVTPSDPLEFHLFHLVRYWSRLTGFCSHSSMEPKSLIDSDLGLCVKVASDFAHRLIDPDSSIYELWQKYRLLEQVVMDESRLSIEQVEAAASAYEACLEKLDYDPWV